MGQQDLLPGSTGFGCNNNCADVGAAGEKGHVEHPFLKWLFFLFFLILSTILAFIMLGSLRKAQFVRVLAGFVDIMSRNNSCSIQNLK